MPIVTWNVVVEHSIWFLYKCAYPVKKVSVRALHRVPNIKRSNPKRKRKRRFFSIENKREEAFSHVVNDNSKMPIMQWKRETSINPKCMC